MKRIGILGGGQLAQMLALAGIPLGLRFDILDPGIDACAGDTGNMIQADYTDLVSVAALAETVDLVTFDFENVPAATALMVSKSRPFYPPVNALEVCQDRITEKQKLSELQIPVPAYQAVSSRPELLKAIDALGLPAVLKTRRFGYDGKGQVILRHDEDLERAWQRLGDSPLILESFVPFDAECSLIAVRALDGEVRFWPLVKNVHHNGVLILSQAGVFSSALQEKAEEMASRLLQQWQYVGVMTIEFFLIDGGLMVNEIAPRVHNSGHWTIDGSVSSQFENHLRAICGWPLGDTAISQASLMFNWLGELPQKSDILSIPGVHWHEYGKTPRPGRKLGHATMTAADQKVLQKNAFKVASILGADWPERLEQLFKPQRA